MQELCKKCNKEKKPEGLDPTLDSTFWCHCGRPTKLTPELIQKAKDYLKSCVDTDEDKEHGINKKVRLPSIGGLAVALEVRRETLHAWDKEDEEFSNILEQLRAIQEERLINSGLSGDYAPTITKVILTKHGYREGIDQTTNDKDLPQPILGGILNENKATDSKI